ncbi:MAG: hypothetical protein KA354_05340 [Phycisphaerae bacterium]|nr:hypothetical protein [Phycisphaerae bacterium]
MVQKTCPAVAETVKKDIVAGCGHAKTSACSQNRIAKVKDVAKVKGASGGYLPALYSMGKVYLLVGADALRGLNITPAQRVKEVGDAQCSRAGDEKAECGLRCDKAACDCGDKGCGDGKCECRGCKKGCGDGKCACVDCKGCVGCRGCGEGKCGCGDGKKNCAGGQKDCAVVKGVTEPGSKHCPSGMAGCLKRVALEQ